MRIIAMIVCRLRRRPTNGAPARQLLPALLYLPTSLSVARTRGCFCCGRWAGTHKCRERRMRRSDKSHQNHFAPPPSAHHSNAWWATSELRLSQGVRRRHIPVPTSGRRGPYPAPYGAARCTGMYECRECRTHTSGLRLRLSSARPKGRINQKAQS